jgi:LPS export ABC transporter protein LptC
LTICYKWRDCPPRLNLDMRMKYRFEIFGFFILSIVIMAVGCSTKEKVSSDSDSHSEVLPDSELRGATIYLYEKDKVTTEVKAEKLLKFEAKDSTMGYVLDINFFDSTGRVSTHLVGDSGVIRETTNQLNVYGNVVVVTKDSSKLETDYLYWNTVTDKIETDAFVRITKKNDVITGWGMEADPDLSRIKILNRVSGTVHDADESDQ